ncbi:MAG: hypothetical protein HRT95_03970 [Moritella sp.]|uniref:hypothetical protein n=1 Tax=Moritella sp. TaxID=78556 RepID=UPI001D91C4C5|nr:hypothetical protein [Moritella sp.]NQZ49361.1 hypothetical protein [Moritella sp.]
MKTNFLKTIIITAWISLLMGCSSSKESVMPPVETTIKQVYQSHSSASGKQSMRLSVQRPLLSKEINMDAYTLHNTPKPDYQLLPNPTLYMFVASKLSRDRSPIPAFITEFKMYERDEYALPHEVSINWEQK